LTRLARDVRGNTLAIMAAALIPLAGLIGGGVDMSRLYLVKTRLQQSCDAGALAGRKAMGAGSWTTGSGNGSTNDKSEKMFAANISAGQYGTSGLTKSFSESNGIVSGSAGISVPMTIMKVFGMSSRALTVTCEAKMELPNTDVMFVLDVTGSMNCVAGDTSCTNNNNVPATGSKILGLKSATKCFYEALLKVNTSEVCGNDPTATTSTTTAQIRIGFVPYSVSVNVGRILPNADIANNWSYQSRAPHETLSTVYGYTLGTESSVTGWGNWSAAPSWTSSPTVTSQSTYASSPASGWSSSGSGTESFTSAITNSPASLTRRPNGTNSTSCPALNTQGPTGDKMKDYANVSSVQSASLQSTTNNPPVRPASQQTLTYSQNDNHTITAYKYLWDSSNSRCQLYESTRTYTLTRTNGTSTKAITWTQYDNTFSTWDYKQVSFDVSSLKTGGSNWATSVSLPIGTTNYSNIKLSGSNSTTSFKQLTSTSVTWDGCVEERQTVMNSDNDPSNEWWPIPANAFDMNIDLLPDLNTAGTVWGPALQNAVWARFDPNGSCTSNGDQYNTVNTACDFSSRNMSYYCTTPASKLTVYNTAANFETYVNSLNAIGNTYHDIGMLWGARLISPTGIFASENANASTGGAIQRHIIFMTDGDTSTNNDNYTAYGVGWWDRRQTTYAPSATDLNNIVNARLDALCTTIKNMNITLWVVSYGGDVTAATENRLKRCSTGYNTTTQQPDGVHYVSATNTAALITQFQNIAAKISELRLTH
jgi:Flp pilus assembly protein TadG